MTKILLALLLGITTTISGWGLLQTTQTNSLAIGGPVRVFTSAQVGNDPTNGDCLTTDGTVSTWDSCSGGAGTDYWNDAGSYLYPKDGDYVSAPYFVATGTVSSTFNSASTTNLTVARSFNFLGTVITNVSTWFNGLFDTQLATKDTGDLTEGSNLYYTTARVNTDAPNVTLAGTPDYITISGQQITRNTIDIGDDTNLAGDTEIVLTGDILSIASTIARDTELHNAVTLAGEDYLSLSTQQITANAIDPDNLSASDFGSFTCNGTTCTVDSSAISNAMLANSSVSYGGITLSLGGSDATPAFNLADATGLPISTGVSGLGTGVATFLATPSTANLASAVTGETGSGAVVFGTSPSIASPTLTSFFGTPCTGNEFLQDISDTGAFTCAAASGGGGGSGGGWATTSLSSIVHTYTSNPVLIGGSATGTAEFYFNPATAQLTISSTTAAKGSITVDGAKIIDSTSGSATLDFIDVLGSTAEATIEAAIDTLSNLTSVGTISTGVWQGTAISPTYLDSSVIVATEIDTSSEIAAIVGDETGSGALVFGTDPTFNSDIFVADTVAHDGDADTYITFLADAIRFTAGNINFLEMVESTSDVVTALAAWDFGGADSLEIPNGASPTLDATGEIAYDTTSGQLKVYDGAAVDVIGNGNFYPAFTITATTTTFTGTTTYAIGTAYVAETWNGTQCFTDVGTASIRYGDGTNWTNSVAVSTTVGTVALSSNNTFTAQEKRYVQIGTPASSAGTVSCSVSKSITAD